MAEVATATAVPLLDLRGVTLSEVFAGLFTVILIGVVVANVVFRTIETRTVRQWGTQS